MSAPTEFDLLFAEISKDMEAAAPVVPEVPVPVVAATVVPAEKPARKFREVDGKTEIEGGPGATLRYPKGYVKVQLPARDWNKMTLYPEDFAALKEFFSDEAKVAAFEIAAFGK